jgi:Na+-transporting NADH:ubiquinone oxidoreductase subunit NqrB
MKALRNYLNKIKPNFEEGGKLHAFRSVFDGFETFLYVPNTTSKNGTMIHDAIDSKRIMSIVVLALMPALLFGMMLVINILKQLVQRHSHQPHSGRCFFTDSWQYYLKYWYLTLLA